MTPGCHGRTVNQGSCYYIVRSSHGVTEMFGSRIAGTVLNGLLRIPLAAPAESPRHAAAEPDRPAPRLLTRGGVRPAAISRRHPSTRCSSTYWYHPADQTRAVGEAFQVVGALVAVLVLSSASVVGRALVSRCRLSLEPAFDVC